MASFAAHTFRSGRRFASGLACFMLVPVLSCVLHAQPTAGMTAHWPFSGNANDASGNGLNGTVYGATLVDDRFGNAQRAYSFDGVNDYIEVPDSPGLDFDSATGITLSFWIKTCAPFPDPFRDMGVLGRLRRLTLGWSIFLYQQQYQTLIVGSYQGPVVSNASNVNLATPVSDGRWHHVAIVITDSVTFYTDGRKENTVRRLNYFGAGDYTTNYSLRIGHAICSSSGIDTYFKGALDDIRFYDRDFSQTDVQSLYTEGGWNGTPPGGNVSLQVEPLTPLDICAGEEVRLRIRHNGAGLQWSTTDGVRNRNDSIVTIAPEFTTTYRIGAFREASGAPCNDTIYSRDTITVTVHERPRANAGDARYICAADSTTLGGETFGGTPPYRWQWTPSDGLSSTNVEQPRLVVGKSQVYTVIATDAHGCRDTADVSINLLPLPAIDLGADTVYYCRGNGGLRIGAEASAANPPYVYSWSPAEGLDRTDTAFVYASPEVATSFVLTVRDVVNCAARDTVTVVPVDAPDVDAGQDTVICSGASVTVGADGTPGIDYRWYPVEGLADPMSSLTSATPPSTTLYYLEATDPRTGCTSLDSILVRVRDPQPVIDTDSIDFGVLEACASDSTITVRLANRGSSDARLESWSVEHPAFVLLDDALVLLPGEEATARIRYAPPGPGVHAGNLTLRFEPCGLELTVSLRGEIREAVVTVPNAIDFGAMLSCELKEVDTVLSIINAGVTPATITAASIAPPFTITGPSLPIDIPPGESRQIRIRYAPAGGGSFVQDLELTYESGDCRNVLRASLSGIVEEPTLETTTLTVDFGLLDGCTFERDTTIVLTNPSGIDVTLSDAAVPAGYTSSTSLPVVVPAGDSIELRLRFVPSGNARFSGDMVLATEPCAGSIRIALDGEKQGIAFSIPDTLDFGDLASCEGAERSLPLLLRFDGDGEGRIDSIAVDGPFTTTLSAGSILPDGVEREFEVTFVPTGEGSYTGSISLVLEPCGLERRIVLAGRATRLELTSTDQDFGVVQNGSSATADVVFRNTGSAVARVDRIEGILPPFALVNTAPSLPADLLPGEELRVTVRFASANGIFQSPVRAVVTAPCAIAAEATVGGEGKGRARCVVVLPVLSARPGDLLQLPLQLLGSEGLDEARAYRWRAEIAFDRTLLVVRDARPWREEDGMRVLTLEGVRTGGTLNGEVPVRATLGRAEMTPLLIRSFEWIDATDSVLVETRDGEFRLDGLCRDGGVRLYDPEGEVGIKSVSPNPAAGIVEVEYELSEAGFTRMSIVNPGGELIATVFEGMFIPGVYRGALDGNDLASGSYWLVLETPTVTVSKRMEIVR